MQNPYCSVTDARFINFLLKNNPISSSRSLFSISNETKAIKIVKNRFLNGLSFDHFKQ